MPPLSENLLSFLLVTSCYSLVLALPSGALENKLLPSSLGQPHKYWNVAIISPVVLLFSRLATPNFYNRSYISVSRPLIILVVVLLSLKKNQNSGKMNCLL